jgi:hypothetical protein
MSYADTLAAESKAVSIVVDFPDLSTRFVTIDHAGLSLPGGYQQFAGVELDRNEGSEYDVIRGALTVGGLAFVVTDTDGAMTAWLGDNDDQLRDARAVVRSGFVGVSESEFVGVEMLLEDYKVESRAGGAYRIELANVLKRLARPLFEGMDGETDKLDETAHASGFQPSDTTLTLEEAPPSTWPQPGYVLVADPDDRIQELVRYETISGAVLQSITHDYWGVGNAHTFPATTSNVYQVWIRRGNPITLALELAITTDRGSANLEAFGSNLTFDQVDGSNHPTGWTVTETGGGIAGNTANVQAAGGRSVELDRTGAGALDFYQDDTGLEPSEWGFVSAVILAGTGATTSDAIDVEVQNVTAGKYLQANGTWAAGAAARSFNVAASGWTRLYVAFQAEAGFANTDTIRVRYKHNGATSTKLYVDTATHRWNYTTEPNGPFDLGDGDGLGIPREFFDEAKCEATRDEFWPEPAWDVATGKVLQSGGTAVLFVEREGVDDLKEWIEQHHLRPYGLKPVVDERERWGVESMFRTTTSIATIGTSYRAGEFNASKWRRGYDRKINQIRRLTDWDVGEGEHAGQPGDVKQNTSITRYGASKIHRLLGRGARTGKLGFPDYNGASDLATGASRIMLEIANPGSDVPVEVFYKFRDLDLADQVELELKGVPFIGRGERGGSRVYFVVRKRIDYSSGFVILKIRERRPVGRPFIIGADALKGSVTYSTATEAQRSSSAFIAPDAGEFANNDPAYEVVS